MQEIRYSLPNHYFFGVVIEKRADRIWEVTEVTIQSEAEKPVQLISVVTFILPAEATGFCLECVGIYLHTITLDL